MHTHFVGQVVVRAAPSLQIPREHLQGRSVAALDVYAIVAHGAHNHVVWRLQEKLFWAGESCCVREEADGRPGPILDLQIAVWYNGGSLKDGLRDGSDRAFYHV